jgi:hypothetical protein
MKAGFAKECITPSVGMQMSGLGQEGGAEGVHDDLFVRALWLADGDKDCVILAFDLLFFERAEIDRFKGAIGRRYDLPPSHLLLNVSHCHSGPRLTRWHYSAEPERWYIDAVERAMLTAIEQAHRRAERVSMHAGMARTNLPVQRRQPAPEGGVAWAPYDEGETCDALPICVFRRGGGEIVSLLFSVACHPSMIYEREFSAGYPGAAARRINEHFGTEGAMFLQGCGGDAKPRPIAAGEDHWSHGSWEDMEEAGRVVAERVVRRVEDGLTEVEPELATCRMNLFFPLLHAPGRTELEAERDAPEASEDRRAWARDMLHRLDREGRLPDAVGIDLHAIQLGRGLRLIGLEAEVVGALGNLIMQEYEGGVTFPLGYTDGTQIYLPSDRMLPEGGYEVESYWEYHWPAPLAAGIDARLRSALQRLRDYGKMPG